MMCLPSGFSFGQKRRAKVSFTTTTLGDLASSAAVKSRPPRNGTRMVWNHCGLTASMSMNGRCARGTFGWPSGRTGVILFHVSGKRSRHRSITHSGKSAHAAQNFVEENDLLLRLCVLHRGHGDVHGEHAATVEAGIDAKELA